MIDVSIIIPDRNGQPYLQKTIDDIILHAETNIEIIVVMDGIWADPPLRDDPRVKIIHHGTPHNSIGMRDSINRGVAASTGKYILKIDEHCMVDHGFDRKLIADCQDNWVVIPRRYRLDPENWTVLADGRPPVDYMAIDYPYQRPFDKTCGLHGAEWKRPGRGEILIDDTPSMQGSCYFMSRHHWDTVIKALDSENYGEFTQEAQEICNKTWFTGGRVVVNKKTWYAHMHKGKRGKGYGFSNEQYQEHMKGTEKGRLYCIEYWLHTKDFIHDWTWFVQVQFPTMPGWENWKERIEKDKQFDYSRREQ